MGPSGRCNSVAVSSIPCQGGRKNCSKKIVARPFVVERRNRREVLGKKNCVGHLSYLTFPEEADWDIYQFIDATSFSRRREQDSNW